uniref:PhaA n=1 Tax=Lysobacter enzymogenes TaxID=69 RepID=A1EBT7_LYSEN|nr:PhaA [Lysobacter enzymogenes]
MRTQSPCRHCPCCVLPFACASSPPARRWPRWPKPPRRPLTGGGCRAGRRCAPPSLFLEFVAIVLPVAVVLGGLVAVLYFLRKRHGLTARDAPLTVLQVLLIGPRERIVVLRTRSGRALAVGVAGQSLNLIAELDPADIAPAAAALGAAAPAAAEQTVASATVAATAVPASPATSPAERES